MIRGNDVFKGVAIGVGVAVMTPLVIAALAPVLKPVARSALKAGIRSYEKARESIEVFNESMDDIIAEVEEEMTSAAAETVEDVAQESGS
ncbi:MAG: DUF5132 domain-containing protein [Gammaproteobacteria bacterium]|nr:DUF5132 domain-containing protein [Gammaproteobacteria bacterium]